MDLSIIQIFVIIQMDTLRCTHCHKNTQQFSILSCDHLVCPECLWGQITTTLQGNNSFKCSCGQITFINNKNIHQSAQITAVGSPRPKSSNQKIGSVYSSGVSTPKTMKTQMVKQFKIQTQLGSELQFLAIRYRKQLQEVQRNFKKIVESLQNKFQNLIKNVKMFWLEEMIQSESLPLLQLPKLLEKKYKKFVGIKIDRINEVFLSQLNTFRLETQPSTKAINTIQSKGISPKGKENYGLISNSIQQRKKMLQFLLKGQDRCNMKKIGRKSDKYRFI